MDKAISKYMSEQGAKGGAVKSEAKIAASVANGSMGGRPSGKIIATWNDDIEVGIWDNEEWTLRLYADRAVLHYPTVKWVNNSGSLKYCSIRIEGKMHARLVKIADNQTADDEDYTEEVKELIWDYMR